MLPIADRCHRVSQESCQQRSLIGSLTLVGMATPSPADALARLRFLELIEELQAERGESARAVARFLGLDETHVPQIARQKRRSVGGTIVRRICDVLGMSADYFAAPSGSSYRDFVRAPTQEEADPAWSAFLERHRATLADLDPAVVGWIRNAPFRGGPSEREPGWVIALDTALRLRGFRQDPMMRDAQAQAGPTVAALPTKRTPRRR